MPICPVARLAGVLLMAALCTPCGRTQERTSPPPYIAAPSNVGSSSASAAAPIVEHPPAHLQSPPHIACWALPSNTKAFCGYYVGGGSACFCRSQPRLATEGTWGWDYHGCLLPQRVALQWWHGRRYQGGAGAYRIDGPPLLKLLKGHKQESGPP